MIDHRAKFAVLVTLVMASLVFYFFFDFFNRPIPVG